MSVGILALLAALPIVAIFIFMVGFRWPATKAMPLAFLITLLLALFIWKTPVPWIAASTLNGVVIAFKILFIVFGALLLQRFENYSRGWPLHACAEEQRNVFMRRSPDECETWGEIVRVNAIAPGLILPPAGHGQEYLDKNKKNVPTRTHGYVSDLTRALDYLIASPFVNGEILFVDGGSSKDRLSQN